MFKLDPVINPKEAASIAKRQRNEEERKKRLFDPRARLIGIDVKALEKQVAEKRDKEIDAWRRDKAFDDDRIQNDHIAGLLEKRLEADRRELVKNLNAFHLMCQKPQDRREYDLNDPDYLKKSRPARISDDDPRCTMSSMQKFEGEDPNKSGRLALQREQLSHWLKQQAQIRKQAEEMEKQADHIYFNHMVNVDKRACQLEEAKEACRQAVTTAVQNFNAALAKQQDQEKIIKRQVELEDNFTEISNAIFGDVLSDPDPNRDAFGPKKTSSANWKGFTAEELADIRRIQKKQVEEKEMMKTKEKVEKKEWDLYLETLGRTALMREIESDREKHIIAHNFMLENKLLARDQKAFQNYLKKEVYINKASPEFFDQFNKTAR